MTTLRDALDEISRIARDIPGSIDQIVATAESLEGLAKRGQKTYKRTHWGDVGKQQSSWVGGIPDPRAGLTAMGHLFSISYVTRKGGDPKGQGQWPVYTHHFGVGGGTKRGPALDSLPILSFTTEERPSGLVVVRGKSRYSVTTRGIEG